MQHRPARVVDAHLHLCAEEGIDRLLGLRRTCGLEAFAVMSLSACGPAHAGQNRALLALKQRAPQTAYIFGGLEYSRPRGEIDPLAQARALRAAGFDGMKMLEGKPTVRKALGLALNDPLYDGYYGWLQAEAVPLLLHVGDPATFWDPVACPSWARASGWFYDASYPTLEQLYGEVEEVLARFPRLKVIFAHFLFLAGDAARAEAFLARHPSACLDLTPGSEMYFEFTRDPAGWRAFFTRHADRILLGTDNTDRDPEPASGGPSNAAERLGWILRFLVDDGPFEAFGGSIQGLGLDAGVVARIAAGNFRRLVGEQPRPLAAPARPAGGSSGPAVVV